MKTMRLMAAAALVSATILSSGCFLLVLGAGAAAGAGTVMYVKGELKSIETVELDKAYQASQDVLDEMGYIIERETTETNKKLVKGQGTYIDSDGSTKKRDITITCKQVSQTETEISIRVDTFGDEAMSREILEKIKAKF